MGEVACCGVVFGACAVAVDCGPTQVQLLADFDKPGEGAFGVVVPPGRLLCLLACGVISIRFCMFQVSSSLLVLIVFSSGSMLSATLNSHVLIQLAWLLLL